MKSFGCYNVVDRANELRPADFRPAKYTYSRASKTSKHNNYCDHQSEHQQLREQQQLELRKKEANIKFHRTRLEHLNDELEIRLRQYELLVAKEKQLLGSYNMLLFTPEGVNNFHLYENYSTPARHIRTLQRQRDQLQRQRNLEQQRASSAALVASHETSTATSGTGNVYELDRDSCGGETSSNSNELENQSETSNSSQTSKLQPSASSGSNLNLMQLLHRLAGPRRSTSSLAIMTMNYQ